MMPQVPNVNQVYAMVNQDECQQIVADTSKMSWEYSIPTTMYSSRPGVIHTSRKGAIMDKFSVITATQRVTLEEVATN